MTTSDNGSDMVGQAAGTGGEGTVAQVLSAEQRVDAVQNGSASAFMVPAEMLEWGKSKGYKPEGLQKAFSENPDLYNMANSYRNAEKALGGEKISLPRDVSDTDAWNQIYSKLGKPETADGYKLPSEGSANGQLSQSTKDVFHKANLTQSQAEAMQAGLTSLYQQKAEADTLAMKQRSDKDAADLQKEWGQEHTANVEIAKRAKESVAKSTGLNDADLDAMEKAIGLSKSLKIMNQIGRSLKLDSDTFEGDKPNERGGALSLTVEQANAEKGKLFSDPAFVKRYQDKEVTARAKIEQLNSFIAPTYQA